MDTKITLLNKEYHGFEAAYDALRDMEEIFEFPQDPAFKKVKGEFEGTIKVTVEFIPAPGDFDEV